MALNRNAVCPCSIVPTAHTDVQILSSCFKRQLYADWHIYSLSSPDEVWQPNSVNGPAHPWRAGKWWRPYFVAAARNSGCRAEGKNNFKGCSLVLLPVSIQLRSVKIALSSLVSTCSKKAGIGRIFLRIPLTVASSEDMPDAEMVRKYQWWWGWGLCACEQCHQPRSHKTTKGQQIRATNCAPASARPGCWFELSSRCCFLPFQL